MKLFKNNFLAGLLVVFPLSVTAWLLGAIFRALWSFRAWMPYELQPQSFLGNTLFALGVLAVLLFGISSIGLFSKFYLGRKALDWVGFLIQRIPLIRSVYSALEQLTRAFASGGGQGQFSRVVYVEYPRAGVWTLAFVTGQNQNRALPGDMINLFVPTTPNPTSGFFLIAPEKDLRESEMSVEDAFKNLISLGIAHPQNKEKPKG